MNDTPTPVLSLDDAAEAAHSAVASLHQAAGMNMVKNGIVDHQHTTMHAVLSIMACQTGTAATFAEVVLNTIGLDPMGGDAVTAALDNVTPIPPALDLRPSGLMAEGAEPTKAVTHDQLVGALMMVVSCNKMLVQRPKLRRAEIASKLDMTIESMMRGFGITQEELDKALA